MKRAGTAQKRGRPVRGTRLSAPVRAACAALLLAGWTGATPARALFFFGPKSDDAKLLAGRAALEDGFYPLARDQFLAYIEETSDRARKGEAAVFLAETLHALGHYAEVIELIDEHPDWAKAAGAKGPFRYWKARSLLELKQFEAVLILLGRPERDFRDAVYLRQAFFLRAQTLLGIGRTAEALEAFADFQSRYPDSPEAAENLLDWAGVLIAGDRADEAMPLLKTLAAEHPKTAFALRGALWLGQYHADRDALDEAKAALLPLTQAGEGADPATQASGWLLLASVEEAQTNRAAAVAALTQVSRVTLDPAVRTRAETDRGRLLILQGETREGLDVIRSAIMSLPEGAEAGPAQLTLAQTLQHLARHEEAVAEFQRYLEAFTEPEGRARALEGKAWGLWELQQYAEAAPAFEKAHAAMADPARQPGLLFKAADALMANTQYSRALERYRQFEELYPQHPLVADSRLQQADCLARSGEPETARELLTALLETDGTEKVAPRIILRLALIEEEQGNWREALVWYDRLLAAESGNGERPRALYRRGINRYRMGRFQEALGDFEAVISRYPVSPHAEEAFHMRGWCHYMMGNDEEAVRLCRAYIRDYPNAPSAPRVLFWLGEYHWNQDQYEQAQEFFLRLAESYPDDALADDGLFWAARAYVKRKEFRQAVEGFTRLAKRYPNSPLMTEARFLQGDALSERGQFDEAILTFDEVILKWPASYLVDAAWGRKGDCQRMLATETPDAEAQERRFEEALSSYRTVYDRPGVSLEFRLQSGYKIGLCYEKKGETDEALAHYMDVVYEFVGSGEGAGSPGALWFTRAAFDAGAILEGREAWRAAVNVYRRVVEAGVPAAADANDRIQKIRLEHWILF